MPRCARGWAVAQRTSRASASATSAWSIAWWPFSAPRCPRVGERTRTRALVVPRAIAARLATRANDGEVRRILVAHNLLLGDTIMLTPLVAKLREQYPQADIVFLAPPAFVPLYASRPYGVRALPF